MLSNIGVSGLILILIALLLVFGPSKLPEIGKAFGKSLREFRSATRDMTDEVTKAVVDDKESVARPVNGSSSSAIEPIVLQERE